MPFVQTTNLAPLTRASWLAPAHLRWDLPHRPFPWSTQSCAPHRHFSWSKPPGLPRRQFSWSKPPGLPRRQSCRRLASHLHSSPAVGHAALVGQASRPAADIPVGLGPLYPPPSLPPKRSPRGACRQACHAGNSRGASLQACHAGSHAGGWLLTFFPRPLWDTPLLWGRLSSLGPLYPPPSLPPKRSLRGASRQACHAGNSRGASRQACHAGSHAGGWLLTFFPRPL